MHAAELMARLNPSTVRYDIGRGGIPELTSQDIAAAVSMVPAGLGRDLLCYLYWPDQTGISKKQMDRFLLDIQLKEWTSRELSMYRALAAVACEDAAENRFVATRQYSEANSRRWPRLSAGGDDVSIVKPYELMRKAVLEEISHPRQCPDCRGEGRLRKRDVAEACSRCQGGGIVRFGTTWRATKLKMKESSFNQRWAGPYDWLYSTLSDALQEAERDLQKAVRR